MKRTRLLHVCMRAINLELILLLVIVGVGFFLRMNAQSHLRVISPDGVAYIYRATKILKGAIGFERRGPFFQLLLLMIFKIFRVSYSSSILVPQFFASVIPILSFILGKRLFDSKTGLVAALLVSVNPILINLSCWVLRETLIVTLALMLILIVHYSIGIRSERRRWMAAIFSGLVTGLLILTREDLLFVIPLAWVAYAYIHKKRKKDLMVEVGIYLTSALLTISPWLVYSSFHFGHPLYSYLIYIPRGLQESGATSNVPSTLFVIYRGISGLWNEMAVLPAIFSILGFAFLPIGVMFTLKKRDIWIIYFIMGAELIVYAWHAGGRLVVYSELVPFRFFDIDRIPFSLLTPANLIIAYGIKRFISFILQSEK